MRRTAAALLLALGAAGASAGGDKLPQARGLAWHNGLLRDPAAWPHSEADSRIAATPAGLRVEVAPGRKFAIAAASRLALPHDMGRIRVRVGEVGGGAKWFLRLYGELRRPGDLRTVGIAQDEESAGQRVFDLDPRLRRLRDAPLQLQLGVEGPPGAWAMFQEVAFLPAIQRSNCLPRTSFQARQVDIPTVEMMPNLPAPFELIDWREKVRAFDRLAFDFRAAGEFLPLVWLDDSRINIDRATFGLPSYVGWSDQAKGKVNSQEGITCMGAVLSGSLVGVDKRRQDHDYVAMCEAWFNRNNGLHLVLNRQRDAGGGSFWYELLPHVVFYALADRYPETPRFAEILHVTAARWRQATLDLADSRGLPDFNHTSFDFRARKPVDNGRWREPDAAAAVAWLQFAAWKRSGKAEYLDAAERCLRFLQGLEANPYYEILLPFGALAAARMNAELDRRYDVHRLLDWCFDVSDTRGGWGVIVGRWGDYDCDGLLGSIDNRCGYSFAMNTFVQAGALAPLPRYDPRYARALGKWMLNLANAARLFYPGALPCGHETSAFWKGDPARAIAYEGLRFEWLGNRPCATGDPVAMRWGPKTDLGLYGSAFVGMLGAAVRPTDDPKILQIDCLATDFFRDKAFPTYLYFNPHQTARSIAIPVGPSPARVYDAVSKRFIAENVQDRATILAPADGAVVAVVVPAGAPVRRDGRRLLVADAVVDYAAE